jgi:chromosome segregation ATPase
MGFASYLEDIRDRLLENVSSINAALEQKNASETRAQAKALLVACERVLDSINCHLDIATDPQVNLAFEVTELEGQQRRLQVSVALLEGEKERLRVAIEQLQQDKHTLMVQLKQLRKENRKKDEEFDALAKGNMAAAYDRYTTPERMKKMKPNA